MIIIGEKINGSIPSVARAIEARNEAHIRKLAKRQAEAGAHYIDVCASVDCEKEVETMKWLIDIVQDTVDTPISIDSPNPHTCVECMSFCNKEGIINSVSLEGDKIETVFPAIANTGWEVIALLCDNHGIPRTVEKRISIADKIFEKVSEYGIEQSRVYIDPLVIALATDEQSMTKFEACARHLRDLFPEAHITSGLSNISFGLPARKLINFAFMVLIYATEALTECDEYCLGYIKAYRQGLIGTKKTK
jgi:5-methyltetrahydrofolate corrinoid/iron sulfur protein methyltransferase